MLSLQSGLRPSFRLNTRTKQEPILSQTLVLKSGGDQLREASVAASLGVKPHTEPTTAAEAYRLSLSVQELFQTGLSLTVLGEAGAGKTTSLQMFARHCQERVQPGDVVLYVPLARLVHEWRRARTINGDSSSKMELESAIATYVSTLGASVDRSAVARAFGEQRSTLILDGIDEASRDAGRLMTAIVDFARRYPATQIVTSSRTSTANIHKLPFLAISLLPFTAAQRCQFFEMWFGNDSAATREAIESHLSKHPSVAQVVTNPLLATVLCVLAESGVGLPDSEYRLYEERMRLLLGQYDSHKHVQRVRTNRTTLECISRRLAFFLHCERVRMADITRLYAIAEQTMSGRLSEVKCRLAVDELIDPCNVLVPMSPDNRCGFGHLRYQEYLAAVNICQDRSVELTGIGADSWWLGVLTLAGQMSQNIEWILSVILRAGEIRKVRSIADGIVRTRPIEEQTELREFIQAQLFRRKAEVDEAVAHSEVIGIEHYSEEELLYDDSDDF